MLTLTISLFFAFAGTFALAAIGLTVRGQLESIDRLLETARDVSAERTFAVSWTDCEVRGHALAALPRQRQSNRGLAMRRTCGPQAPAPLCAAA